ncbi:unnamed protein product [Caenorhabditis auriculariae]|uniref:Uncharacterized protein n=1 Tax=Caenorhabditis auriculariae TaxID=2777116 RepID=A0A8S1H2Z2_9PELO|nr:unnamed protein product [Caenorhabditis auriculariae]
MAQTRFVPIRVYSFGGWIASIKRVLGSSFERRQTDLQNLGKRWRRGKKSLEEGEEAEAGAGMRRCSRSSGIYMGSGSAYSEHRTLRPALKFPPEVEKKKIRI